VWPSCFSDSDFGVPNTVEEAILGTSGAVDVVVVMAGYNDWNDPFGSFVDTIMSAARTKGAERVVFLTLSEGTPPGSSATAMGVYAENTQLLWDSTSRHPDLVVADWRTYIQRSVGWMEADGVHLRARGAHGLADYISRWIAHVDGRTCTAPLDPGRVLQHPCPDPNTMARVPDIAGVHGV
jgi:lysophospholipase L1-like esterase